MIKYYYRIIEYKDKSDYLAESTTWYRNRLRHRENGPAVIGFDNTKHWYYKGLRHREDGPAYEDIILKQWWVHSKFIKESWNLDK